MEVKIMSLHPSLKSNNANQQKRVLSRLEKMISLKKKDKWSEEDYVLGLPKVKVLKFKPMLAPFGIALAP